MPTGLKDLDERLGGLHKSDLVIVAGRPSMGKTALATNIAYHASKKILDNNEKTSVAFSLEMSSEQLSTRIISEQSRIKSNDIRRGKISEEEFNRLIETSRKNIHQLPLVIDETPAIQLAPCQIELEDKKIIWLSLIVVDYIQLMTTEQKDLKEDARNIRNYSGSKSFSKRINVPVLALSQLSRAVEQRDDKKPQLADPERVWINRTRC